MQLFKPVIGGNKIQWLNMWLLKLTWSQFCPFIYIFKWTNLYFYSFYGPTCRASVTDLQSPSQWNKNILIYISLLMLDNCQTSGQRFTTKTVHLPVNTEGNVRGMHRLLSWLSTCRTTFQLISVQHKQQTKKSIFPDSPSSENKTHFYTLPPCISLKACFAFCLFPGYFAVCFCTIKFFHVTSHKGHPARGVKEYTDMSVRILQIKSQENPDAFL